MSAEEISSIPAYDVPDPIKGKTEIDLERYQSSVGSRFYRGYLLPRLSSILGDLRPAHAGMLPGEELTVDGAYTDLAFLTRHCFERATRKAFRSYLLDSTGLEDRAQQYRDGRNRTDASGDTSGVRLRVGACHAVPKLDIRCRLGEHTGVRITLRTVGAVGVEFDRSRNTWTRLYAGYDHRHGRYDLALRVGF